MYAVLSCTRCGRPVAVDARHASSSCQRCRARVPHAEARTLWTGTDAREAQAVVARVEAGGRDVALPAPLPRHDDPLDAAAARARGLVNRSQRAEAVALWSTRLLGEVPHESLLEAMGRAGLDPKRAQQELVRMLACDILMEPKPGRYRVIG